MFGLGMGEVVLLVIIAVVLFGTNDLPKTLRKVAKGVGEFKKVANDAQRSWTEVRDDVTRTIMAADLEETVRKAVHEPVKAVVAADSPPPSPPAPLESLSEAPSEGTPAAPSDPSPLPPVARPADNAVVRSPEGPAVDHHHDHHEERGTQPDTPAALPGGERKTV